MTDKRNVADMDNETHKCSECGKDMTGRTDRKFCSAACRQKAYRRKRNETVTRDVTAKPFPLNDDPTPYKTADDFWRAVSSLPDILGDLAVFDADSDYERFGHETRPLVSLYPPRRKSKAQSDADIRRAVDELREFMRNYDAMVANLPRIRATVEVIAKRNEYNLEQ